MNRIALLMVVSALWACDSTDSRDVESLFAVNGTELRCDEASAEAGKPKAPFLSYYCTWENVRVGGVESCRARVDFDRASFKDTWIVTSVHGWSGEDCH